MDVGGRTHALALLKDGQYYLSFDVDVEVRYQWAGFLKVFRLGNPVDDFLAHGGLITRQLSWAQLALIQSSEETPFTTSAPTCTDCPRTYRHMAPPVAEAKLTLSYPIYAAGFDPKNTGFLVVGGGGGEGRSGVGNKIVRSSNEKKSRSEG